MGEPHGRALIERIRDVTWLEHELSQAGALSDEVAKRLEHIRDFLHELLADLEDARP